MRVLLTRGSEESAETARALKALGHQVVEAPLIEILWRDLPRLPAGSFDGMILTSRNGLRFLERQTDKKQFQGLPLAVVGERTAAIAVELGYQVEFVAENATALIVQIERHWPTGRFLYLRGKDVSHDLAARLANHKRELVEFIVYDAVARPVLPEKVLAALAAGEIEAALFYSRRTAELFLQAHAVMRPVTPLTRVRAYCLSAAVADVLPRQMFAGVEIAARPDEAALLALLPRGGRTADV